MHRRPLNSREIALLPRAPAVQPRTASELEQPVQKRQHAAVDLTADDDEPQADRERDGSGSSTLRHLAELGAELGSTIKRVKRERDDHESRSELLDSMVGSLEEHRHILKEQVSHLTRAMLDAGVPIKRKRDADVPNQFFFYNSASYTTMQQIPWNEIEDRPMTLAEAFNWALAQPVRSPW